MSMTFYPVPFAGYGQQKMFDGLHTIGAMTKQHGKYVTYADTGNATLPPIDGPNKQWVDLLFMTNPNPPEFVDITVFDVAPDGRSIIPYNLKARNIQGPVPPEEQHMVDLLTLGQHDFLATYGGYFNWQIPRMKKVRISFAEALRFSFASPGMQLVSFPVTWKPSIMCRFTPAAQNAGVLDQVEFFVIDDFVREYKSADVPAGAPNYALSDQQLFIASQFVVTGGAGTDAERGANIRKLATATK